MVSARFSWPLADLTATNLMANPESSEPHSLLVTLLSFSKVYSAWVIFAVVVLRYLRRRYISPLRRFPGPVLASCSRLWKIWSTASGHTEMDHIAVHRKYGSIVRVAPDEVSLSSPSAARELLAAGKGFHKSDFYSIFPPPENPDIFTETREHIHAQKKRAVSAAYSMAAMQQQSVFIEDTINLLLKKLDSFSGPEATPIIDLGEWLHYFAFDVLGEIAFRKKFGFLENGMDVEGCIRTIDNSQWYNGIVGQMPILDAFLRRNPLWNLVPFMSTQNALITKIALKAVGDRKHKGQNSNREDLLDQLLKAHEAQPDKFSEGDVFAVAHGAIFAGSDSTASTMQSFFHFVLKDPAVYARIVDEVDRAQSTNTLSPYVTWAAAQKLQYFQACLKESMRLRPAVGLNICRLIPPTGAVIDGTSFEGCTRVAVNAWVLHRDRHVFGQDAETFRPERWLDDENPEQARVMERHMFQFGGGSHICIGKNLALLEMNKVLPTLLRKFSFELVQPHVLKHHSTFFVVQSGLKVCLSTRNPI